MLVANLWARLRREDGQALVEYALILSLVAVVCIGALSLTGTSLVDAITNVANKV